MPRDPVQPVMSRDPVQPVMPRDPIQPVMSRDPVQPVIPMKLFVRCVGDLATGGGSVLVVTSFWALPDSFFVCLRGLGISKFILLWRLAYALVELSFREMVTGARRTRGTLAISASA